MSTIGLIQAMQSHGLYKERERPSVADTSQGGFLNGNGRCDAKELSLVSKDD